MTIRFFGRTWMAGAGVVAAVAALGVGDSACSIVVNTSGEQCKSDSECQARGGEFASTKCGGDGICIPQCETSRECDTKTLGAETVCAANRCVPLRSASTVDATGATVPGDCFAVLDGTKIGDPAKLGDVTYDLGEDPVILGFMADVIEGKGSYFLDGLIADGIAMALSQLNSNATFPGNRKVVALVCAQTNATAVAQHLVEVGAKAIIGPTTEPRSVEVADVIATSKVKIPIISSWLVGSSAGSVSGMNGYVWLPAPSREDLLPPLQAKLSEVEADIKAQIAATPPAPAGATPNKIRVAAVFDEGAADGLYKNYRPVLGALNFNGPTVSAALNETDASCTITTTSGSAVGCYRAISTAIDPQNPSAGAKSNADVAKEIRAFKPDVIIPVGEVTAMGGFPPLVEKGYGPSDKKPRWIVPFNQIEFAVFKAIETYVASPDPKNPALEIPASAIERISGIRVFRGSNDFDGVVQESRIFVGSRAKDPDNARPFARGFEDTYLAYYASFKAATLNPKFSSADVAAAIPLVTDPTAVAVPSRVSGLTGAGIKAIQANENISLRGLLSTFKFDTNTGQAPGQWEAWRLAANGTQPFVPFGTTTTLNLGVYVYTGKDPGGNCFDPNNSSFTTATCDKYKQ